MRCCWSIARRGRAARKGWSEKIEWKTHGHRGRGKSGEKQGRRLHICLSCVVLVIRETEREDLLIKEGYRCDPAQGDLYVNTTTMKRRIRVDVS